MRDAGGDVDAGVRGLLVASEGGLAVVYDEEGQPPDSVAGGGVPPSDEAAARRRAWADELNDDAHFEALKAISSGAYELQPVGFAEGEMTAFEEAMAGLRVFDGATATPARPGDREGQRSPGTSRGWHGDMPAGEATTPVMPGGRKRQRRSPGSAGSRQRVEARRADGGGGGSEGRG